MLHAASGNSERTGWKARAWTVWAIYVSGAPVATLLFILIVSPMLNNIFATWGGQSPFPPLPDDLIRVSAFAQRFWFLSVPAALVLWIAIIRILLYGAPPIARRAAWLGCLVVTAVLIVTFVLTVFSPPSVPSIPIKPA